MKEIYVWLQEKHTDFSRPSLILLNKYVYNWLRDHTSEAYVELGWRLKVFPSSIFVCFWISLHQGTPSYYLFLKCKCSMLSHMNKVNPFISTACFCMRHKIIYSNNWYQSGLQSHVCITCWVSFRIIENSFHGFENSTVIFLHSLISKLSLMKLKLMLWCCFSLMLSMPNWTLRL